MDNKQLFSIKQESAEQVELQVKYEGYILRQDEQVERFHRMENWVLPENMDYAKLTSLRIEAREKLGRLRPATLGAASRISGVSPGDISILMVVLRSMRKDGENDRTAD